MLTISDIEPHIQREFGSRLEPLGFQRVAKRKWVRSQKLPIRELFVIGTLKGAQYSPVWGFSSGCVPWFDGRSFRRQSTDKNAVMDLVIDPVDLTGAVPPEAFRFISGYDKEIPLAKIRACAEHFVPLALENFQHVHSVSDFCKFFLARSRLQYRRFTFDMYIQHQLIYGFVLIMTGRRGEGLEKIREFCRTLDAHFDDRVLSDCIRHAESSKTEI